MFVVLFLFMLTVMEAETFFCFYSKREKRPTNECVTTDHQRYKWDSLDYFNDAEINLIPGALMKCVVDLGYRWIKACNIGLGLPCI